MSAKTKGYAWARKIEAACITVITRGTARAALAALGATPHSKHASDFRAAEAAWSADNTPVQVWKSGKFVLVVEPNGFQASLAETLIAMANNADAVSFFWNVNAQMKVTVVARGELLRTFDPLLYDDGEPPLPEEKGLRFGCGDVQAAALVFLQRRTGFIATKAEIVDAEHRPINTGAAEMKGRCSTTT